MPAGAPIALFYFTLFGALGIFWPYFALFLASRGLAPGEITRLIGLYPLMALVVPPLAGLVADAWRARGWLLRALAGAMVLAFATFFAVPGAGVALWVATALFGFFRSPLGSMADASALEHVRRHGGSYGRLRLWGSVGFLVAVVGGGELYDHAHARGIMIATLALLGLAAASAWGMPAAPPRQEPRALPAWKAMLARRDLWLLLAAVALAQAGGAAYDACFTLHLQALGHGGRFTGIAWAIGVASEVCLMAGSARLIARVGAASLFAATLATATVRWAFLARVVSPTAILLLQPLHGVTFGLFWVAGVTLVRDRAPTEAATAAQGIFAAAIGLGSVAGMSVAGNIFHQSGAAGLWTRAAEVAAVAFLFATAYALYARRVEVDPAASVPEG